ncbi:hypothetical protein NR756_10100 [Alloalcanivorax xenomutans]|uniref:hypothetical protein n=1 Tax=Alloalcanivorax xenomutans TaxID=1094342 RepID=UPI003A808D45
MIRIVVALLALAGSGLVLAGEAPQRGMTQNQVRAQFGAPQDTKGPVGQPPISRWGYPDYTVYFENQVVLHSVTRPLSEAADTPKPADSGEVGDTTGDTDSSDDTGNEESSPPPQAPKSARDSDAPPTAPQDDTASEAEDGGDDGQFRFDPVTGRIVIDDRPATDQGGETARE